VYGRIEDTLLAAVPASSVPECVAPEQFSPLMAAPTLRFKIQDTPPMFSTKLAVPVREGVPVMTYVKVPAPSAKLPANKVAVSPSTPEEATLCPPWLPLLPPV
jgi:hypothetical protein